MTHWLWKWGIDRDNDSPSWAILLTNPHHPTSNINVGPDVRGSAKWPSLSIHSAPICQELATATSLESECLDVVCNNFGSWKMNTAWHICRGGVMAKKNIVYENVRASGLDFGNQNQLSSTYGKDFLSASRDLILPYLGCSLLPGGLHCSLWSRFILVLWKPVIPLGTQLFEVYVVICCNMLYMSISHGELKEKSTSETIPKPPNISKRGNLLIFASKIPIRAKEKTSQSALHLARRSQPVKTLKS